MLGILVYLLSGQRKIHTLPERGSNIQFGSNHGEGGREGGGGKKEWTYTQKKRFSEQKYIKTSYMTQFYRKWGMRSPFDGLEMGNCPKQALKGVS